MNKKIILVFFISFCFPSTYLSAASSDRAVDSSFHLAELKKADNTVNKLGSPKEKVKKEDDQEDSWVVPEWVRRTNFTVQAGSDQKPQYFIETIQPLFGSQFKDIVIFNQTRISSQGERPKYNIGFGLRKIFWESLLLGVNRSQAKYLYSDFW
ncbi:MAG: inverse autotransporter beta domain-containing protein [Candidatus Omnitrophica bacterium]|nr:inverse autotransporter beta domain-containing protein [Candidatus Omnitrophota bacterium]